MFVQPAEGLLVVTNEAGETLKTGDPISKGQVLHITASPYSNFELASLTVNGQSCSGTYTVGDVSITVKATFSVKQPEAPDPEIDPNTQYIVTLPGANDVRNPKPQIQKSTRTPNTLSHFRVRMMCAARLLTIRVRMA